jgi:hypothetical protein
MGARPPAGALVADRELPALGAQRSGRAVEQRARIAPRRPPVPALDRLALARTGRRNQQRVATAMRARAPRLRDQPQRLTAQRHRAGRPGDDGAGRSDVRETAIDPRPQLADGRVRLAAGRTLRQRDGHLAVVLDPHAHRPRPRRAAHGVLERLVHPPQATHPGGATR